MAPMRIALANANTNMGHSDRFAPKSRVSNADRLTIDFITITLRALRGGLAAPGFSLPIMSESVSPWARLKRLSRDDLIGRVDAGRLGRIRSEAGDRKKACRRFLA